MTTILLKNRINFGNFFPKFSETLRFFQKKIDSIRKRIV
ncbi:hypothetical protein G436_4210 [Leptospira interrogans serovar Hardjo str. Norma]|uniref:Uncharacterized protein n=1 Tax=Leptospira interrogans serovar Hardjo str. Norma TaxID=1279460 RepID=A0A0M4NNF9_LEPIR|nr:hypothetical protein G436_4210 [Leptospira interrogans serovar Hardjo str. Norma]